MVGMSVKKTVVLKVARMAEKKVIELVVYSVASKVV